MAWHRIYGNGLTPFDIRLVQPNHVEFTIWLTLFWIPVIPIRSWRAMYVGENPFEGVTQGGEQFINAIRIPNKLDRIVVTFLKGLILTIAGIVPAAYLIWRTDGRAATNLELASVFASAVWPLVLIIASGKIRLRLLRASNAHLPEIAKPKGRWWEVIGVILLFAVGLPAWGYERFALYEHGQLYVALFILLASGVGGYLVLPSCPRGGTIVGLIAGPSGFISIYHYVHWRPDAEPNEIYLVQVAASLPAIYLGYLLHRRNTNTDQEQISSSLDES